MCVAVASRKHAVVEAPAPPPPLRSPPASRGGQAQPSASVSSSSTWIAAPSECHDCLENRSLRFCQGLAMARGPSLGLNPMWPTAKPSKTRPPSSAVGDVFVFVFYDASGARALAGHAPPCPPGQQRAHPGCRRSPPSAPARARPRAAPRTPTRALRGPFIGWSSGSCSDPQAWAMVCTLVALSVEAATERDRGSTE